MEMIGHDHEFVKLNRRTAVLDLQPMFSSDLTEESKINTILVNSPKLKFTIP